MDNDKVRLVSYGIAGVLIASLILAGVRLLPSLKSGVQQGVLLGVSVGDNELSSMEGPRGVAYQTELSLKPNWTSVLNVTVYEFSEPRGPGSNANLAIAVESKLDFSETFNVTVNFISAARMGTTPGERFPGGVLFSDKGFVWSWTGEIEANGTRAFSHIIQAISLGTTDMIVEMSTPSREIAEGYRFGLYQRVDMVFVTLPDNVFLYSGIPRPKDVVILDDFPIGWHGGGVGTEFNYSIKMSGKNVTNVVLKLVIQKGIVLVKGQNIWIGNETSELGGERIRATLRFDQVGIWFVYTYAEKDGILLHTPSAWQFTVSESNSTAYGF